MKIDFKGLKKRPIIISFLSQKGGCGKTTLSINVAHALKTMGAKVLLFDADEQGSCMHWKHKNGGKIVTTAGISKYKPLKNDNFFELEIQTHKPNYDIIVVDGPPGLTDLTLEIIKAVDIVLIPAAPSYKDIDATNDIGDIIYANQLKFGKPDAAFVASRVPKKGTLEKSFTANLIKFFKNYKKIPSLSSYTSSDPLYIDVDKKGKTVLSLKNSGPAKEIMALTSEIIRRFISDENTRTPK